MDNVLVANETIEKNRCKKKSCILLKVDYEKIYDLVSWMKECFGIFNFICSYGCST